MENQIIAPQYVHVSMPTTCKYAILHGKRTFMDMIKLRVLRWVGYPESSGRSQCDQRILRKGGRRLTGKEV